MDDRLVGLLLAILSSILIGVSYVITKKGLIANQGGGSGYSYLRNLTWWLGMTLMVLGEVANFIAYGFAPAILVTPLGALSVLTSAVLAAFFLNEELGRDGKIGSALSLIGAVIIILHAPEEPKVDSVDVILQYAVNPGFIVYSLLVLCTSFALICYVAPKHGRTNPLVYIAICSLVGSITVISCKALGIALKLTGEGNNQFVHLSTYVFILIVAVCIVTQMNYFNMALDIFSTSIVTPVYYVFFTTATIIATVILFKGIYDTSASNFVSVVFGFITIFLGVFLLNTKKSHSEAINNFYTERELGMDPLNNEEEAF